MAWDSAIAAWVEDATGGRVVTAREIPAGGRRGFFVDLQLGSGEVRSLFLQVGRRVDPEAPTLFHPFTVEAEILRALEPVGIPVPHVWGMDPDRNLLLVDRVPGQVWFHPPADPAEQESVARDFVRHLATWHAVPAAKLDVPSLGPAVDWKTHQREQLVGISRLVELADNVDPLVRFTLEWLGTHIPDADGDAVLVQGDTGPGNFLYADGRVTGIVDWELAHLGDPMDDIAWMSWRATQHGFPDFAARLREYEALSGITVDDDRVRYYRLNAFGRLGPRFGIADMGASTRPLTEVLNESRAADGSWMIMSILHRRMRLEATSAALDLPVPSRDLDAGPVKDHASAYDSVLEQLRTLAQMVDDPKPANLSKAIARQVKYLKEVDRSGDLFAAAELDDIATLLGRRPAALPEGRDALVAAVREHRVAIEDYVGYHWQRLRRDDHLMRTASGALFERSWPALR